MLLLRPVNLHAQPTIGSQVLHGRLEAHRAPLDGAQVANGYDRCRCRAGRRELGGRAFQWCLHGTDDRSIRRFAKKHKYSTK